jgi:hypothetical protein
MQDQLSVTTSDTSEEEDKVVHNQVQRSIFKQIIRT